MNEGVFARTSGGERHEDNDGTEKDAQIRARENWSSPRSSPRTFDPRDGFLDENASNGITKELA